MPRVRPVHSRRSRLYGGLKRSTPIRVPAALDFNRHERKVLAPLALTGFFETYDVALLTLAAPVLAQGLGVGIGTFAMAVALIRVASLASVPVLRWADRIGRRTMLLISIAGFSLATGLTTLAVGLASFVACQALARAFLATESSLASLVIAEELRPDRRGAGLSLLGVLSGIGFGAVGGVLLLVPITPLDWRLFYLVALFPLAIVIYLRRNLGETRAFAVARDRERVQASFWPRVSRPDRRLLWRAAGILSAFGTVQTAGYYYAADLAQTTYGWSGIFTAIVISAGVFGVAGFYLGGRLSDRFGRRPLVALALTTASAGTVLMFVGVKALFIPGFYLTAAASACFLTVSLAYIAELFPTEVRATLSAFLVSCQVAAGSIGLALVGGLRGTVSTSLLMVILGGALVAALPLLRGLPETGGRDLVSGGSLPPVGTRVRLRRPLRVAQRLGFARG